MQSPQFQAHASLEDRHWWFLARRDIFRSLLHAVCPPQGNASLLDVGCGTGGNTADFAREYRCLGIDPSAEAIAYAQARFPQCSFRVGRVPDDCREDVRAADIVLLADVLEHVEDDFLFLSSLLSEMKAGAHLLLMAPADPRLWGPHDRGFEHYRRYTLQRLSQLWDGLPVDMRVASYCNSRLYPIAAAARAIGRWRGRALGPSETDLSLPIAPANALLRWLFCGERKRLLRILHGRASPYAYGVSVIALLRRREGEIAPRRRPSHIPKDAQPWMHDG